MNRAVLALILASVLWGTTGTAASRMTGVSPVAIGASTMAVGGALLFGASARVSMRALRDRAARRWVLLGAVGVVVYPLAFYTGMHLAGIAIGNVVALGSGPAFAALLEWILGGRRPGPRWLAATGVAVAGVVVLGVAGRASPRATGAPGQEVAVGLLLALAAGAAYALYTYSAGRVTALGHGGRAAMGGTFGVGAVILLPICWRPGGRFWRMTAPSRSRRTWPSVRCCWPTCCSGSGSAPCGAPSSRPSRSSNRSSRRFSPSSWWASA